MGAPTGLCIIGGQYYDYVLRVVCCWLGALTPFVDCWEVLWLCDVGEVVVLFGGSWVVR